MQPLTRPSTIGSLSLPAYDGPVDPDLVRTPTDYTPSLAETSPLARVAHAFGGVGVADADAEHEHEHGHEHETEHGRSSQKPKSSRGGRALASLKRTASLFKISMPRALLPQRAQNDASQPSNAANGTPASRTYGKSQMRINQYVLRHRYEVFKQVGDGSFGTVCLARQHGTQTGEYVSGLLTLDSIVD